VSAVSEAQVCCGAEYHGGDQQANDVRREGRWRRFVGFRRRHVGLKAESSAFRLGGLAWLARAESVESPAEGGGSKKQYDNSSNHKRGAAQLTVERFGDCSARRWAGSARLSLVRNKNGGRFLLYSSSGARSGRALAMLSARTEATAFPSPKRPFYS
jgi:hypothetical protein